MKLAFSGEARYPDFGDAYELYLRRARTRECLDEKIYKAVVKEYCKSLSQRLEKEGVADLPCGFGAVAAVTLERKPQYRGRRFVGYGKYDWKTGTRDGRLEAFGIVFLPSREKNANLRCYGFVANRRLYKRMKESYDNGTNSWYPMRFNDEMI